MKLVEHNKASREQLQHIEQELLGTLDTAVKEAVDAPWPNPDRALEEMFA
jgi:TPP-dependent pyruvate/acetoin dehydrogenase alpha subunit